jgi:polyphenol oxidase
VFQKRLHNNQWVGYEGRTANALFFFGNGRCPQALLPELYPQFAFRFLKQVHGDRIVDQLLPPHVEADGHATGETNIALVIQTADCLPILLSGGHQVAALHAGWRGLAAGIIRRSETFGPFEHASIGPHIRAVSYEVGLEVVEQLAANRIPGAVLPHADPNKKRIDMEKIAQFQLRATYPTVHTTVLSDDTFTSMDFHSFRRGKEVSQRQYSFVALTENGIK